MQASSAQKTIVAGMAPPIMGGQMMQPGMMPPGMQPPGMPMTGGMVQQGASTLFWIISLAVGVAVGVVAYLIVCQL